MQADKLCRRYVCAVSSASDDENSHALLERLLKTRDIQQPVLLTEALKIYIPQAVRLFTTRVRTRRRLGGRQCEYIAFSARAHNHRTGRALTRLVPRRGHHKVACRFPKTPIKPVLEHVFLSLSIYLEAYSVNSAKRDSP